MENLKSPVKRVLLDYIDFNEVGAYYDSTMGVNMLSFKKYGVNIPYVAGSFNGAKTVTNWGTAEAESIQLWGNMYCPCKSCDWDYNVTIVKKVQYPGVNNIETDYNRKSYNGVIGKITCTGNIIDDVWLLQAEDDIINQITSDTGMENTNPDPITGGGACVYAKREYKITMSAIPVPVTDSITIKNYTTGSLTVLAGTGAGTALTYAAVINAQTAVTGVIALVVNTQNLAAPIEILLQSATPGQLFTVALTAGSTIASIDYRRILLISKTARTQFAVQYSFGKLYSNPVNPQILFNKSQWVIDASAPGATPNAGISFFLTTLAGVTTQYNIADTATAAAETAAINAAIGQHDGYATLIGTNIYVNGDDALSNMYMAVSLSPSNYVSAGYTAASVFVQLACTFDQWGNVLSGILPETPRGSFPIGLGSEVFQKLARNTDPGSVPFQYEARPDPFADYVCYFMSSYTTQNAATGGDSTYVAKKNIVEVYIKKSLLTTSFLYATVNGNLSAQAGSTLNAAPTAAANVTLEALMQLWAGTGTIAAATGIVTGGLNPNAWTN